ncbi:hypothetical protein ACLIIZ_15585 [Azonexus caeni]|jgi:hypothetical protein|uniref:hypothetical protein n=1 Tax=Azonexus caeni TaxID=266126 RepID=UPI003A8A1341
MRIFKQLALWFVGLFMHVSLHAEVQVNGCGSGWNSYLVPDRIRPLACEFKAACDRHDRCYGACENVSQVEKPQCEYLRCQKGGDLHGQDECDGTRFNALRSAAMARKDICDSNFYADLVTLNPNRPQCRVFSWLYPFAVKVLGASAFIGIDGTVTAAFSEEQKQAYADAINAMLSQWTPEQLLRFEEELKSGEIKVDFTKQLKFDSARGLFNP